LNGKKKKRKTAHQFRKRRFSRQRGKEKISSGMAEGRSIPPKNTASIARDEKKKKKKGETLWGHPIGVDKNGARRYRGGGRKSMFSKGKIRKKTGPSQEAPAHGRKGLSTQGKE